MATFEELEREIRHLRELIGMMQGASNQALKLQAKEYERRLDALNGEAVRLRNMQQTYVPRETYEAHHTELHNICNDLKSYQDKASGRNEVISIIISIGVSIAIGVIVTLINVGIAK